jgi:hypothetical protein
MANDHSIFAFLARQLGYASEFVAKATQIAQADLPEAQAILTSVTATEGADQAAFQAGQAVVSPSVGATIDGHAYKLTVHFDPA